MGLTKAAISLIAGQAIGPRVQRTTVPPLTTVTVIGGPAAGFIRLAGDYLGNRIQVMVSSLTPGYVNFYAFLNGPFGAVRVGGGSVSGEYEGGQMACPILAPGESLTVQNLDAVESLSVLVTYTDFPNTDWTFIRVPTNGMTPVTLMSAAPAGKSRVLCTHPAALLLAPEEVSGVWYFNRDDVAHGLRILNGTAPVVNFPLGSIGPVQVQEFTFFSVDSSGALTALLRESTNTVEGLLVAAYRELSVA